MRKSILALLLASTSFCGLGDEYKSRKYPGYKREHTTKENLEDVAFGFVTSASLASAGYFCYMSGSPPLMCLGWTFRLFAAGCVVCSCMFSEEIEVRGVKNGNI